MRSIQVLTLVVLSITSSVYSLNPVVILNGLGGSIVKAKLTDKPQVAHTFCRRNSDWFTLWLNLEEILPGIHDCFIDNFTPRYNFTSNQFYSPPGVQLDTNYDFGGVRGITYIDPDIRMKGLAYFERVVEKLEEFGYLPGSNLHGAPYDWRMSPSYLSDYYRKLQQLIELTYKTNDRKPVHLLTHSLGGPVALRFLNKMPQAWKDLYIRSFIPVSPPFGGSSVSLEGMVFGYNFRFPLLPIDWFFPVQALSPSGSWSLPQALCYKKVHGETPILITPSNNYTTGEYKQMFSVLQNTVALATFSNVHEITLSHLESPLVDTYIMYGSGIKTPSRFEAKHDLLPVSGSFNTLRTNNFGYRTIYSDGDGTVIQESMTFVDNWDHRGYVLNFTEMQKVPHMESITHPSSVQLIADLIADLNLGKSNRQRTQ